MSVTGTVETIADVAGISVGHYTDLDNVTGCTVVLCPGGAVAAVDAAGGAPGTRETDLLGPSHLVQEVHAILLTGGSAFGLDAAGGVMRYLADRGSGFRIGTTAVPIVPAAVLYDLGIGSANAYPDADAGFLACRNAEEAMSGGPEAAAPVEGSVGAGTGATVGKLFGIRQAVKGGVGTAALRLGSGHIVGAIVVVNALGDVVSPVTGQILAGPRDPRTGEMVSTVGTLVTRGPGALPLGSPHTTIGVVATDATLTRDQLIRVARMAQDGLSRTVRPAHTLYDGDVIFALATGKSSAGVDPTVVGTAAAEVVATAIVRSILLAQSMAGIPSVSELKKK